MLTPTHLVTAQTAFLSGSIMTGHAPILAEASVALMAALIPDLDSHRSYVGRMLPFISSPLEHQFGHRTLTHSLMAQITVGALAYLLLPFGYFLAIVCGWLSHILADMMTPAGVCWFWPSRVRCVIPGNVKYRIDSMGQGELVFLLMMALIGLLLKPLAGTGLGTMGLIRSAIGNIASARQDYDAQKGANAWSLEVKGRDNRSYGDIAGTYPVIGPYRENGFILDTPEGPRSLCLNSVCDWYGEHASLIKGKAEITTTTSIEQDLTDTTALISALAPMRTVGKVYLLGTLKVKRIPAKPPTIETTTENVTLHYANPALLETWGNRSLSEVNITIQVRHAPGVQVPEIEKVKGEGRELHPLLEKWLGWLAVLSQSLV